jgi:hypothetical protein
MSKKTVQSLFEDSAFPHGLGEEVGMSKRELVAAIALHALIGKESGRPGLESIITLKVDIAFKYADEFLRQSTAEQ